ncbi:SAM-dependent methyltransferase [Pararhodobacter marinus]|uniref:tRNA (N6-threonylcarbamoyladenosine(37)-N6)-methyltransferase TrmO n=1 Tax=Pararhodobacter marinus TaxID=2184063 RepID=A0A2U2CGS3_9RHOB|nr:SAM-dependent methyltransferase [Pararhodobacter marinus]PWE31052.1 tRNA (N6-threonylcarbamoyladenosine(37)-N6)-methyltransferase TrmO [Pararhodobacter marinus]
MNHKPLKPGEEVTQAALSADASLGFIGHVETPWKTLADCPKRADPDGPVSLVVVDPPWDRALLGVGDFAWIELYLWFHEARRDLLVIAPGHAEGLRGVFSVRSPVRPNPIAVTTVRLLGIEGNTLRVAGLEALDGTPLLDIKPGRCPVL